MTFQTFQTTILTDLQEYYGEDYTLRLHQVKKNNRHILDGIIIQKTNCNIAPTIYLNSYYEKYQCGVPYLEIIEHIKNTYAAHAPSQNIELDFFTDFEQVKGHICMKLIHTDRNKELLAEIPYIPFLDLSIVFYYYITLAPFQNASILIHNNHMEMWKTNEAELLKLAQENTPVLLPYYYDDIFSMISSLSDYSIDIPIDDVPLHVLTNSEKLYGATAILYPNVLSSIAARLNQNLIIIPSSIHEVLLIPTDMDEDKENLNELIHEVNTTQLLPDEILSDHTYYYNRITGIIS